VVLPAPPASACGVEEAVLLTSSSSELSGEETMIGVVESP